MNLLSSEPTPQWCKRKTIVTGTDNNFILESYNDIWTDALKNFFDPRGLSMIIFGDDLQHVSAQVDNGA
jgi:hypothetical protein